jgi:hypothetical protein
MIMKKESNHICSHLSLSLSLYLQKSYFLINDKAKTERERNINSLQVGGMLRKGGENWYKREGGLGNNIITPLLSLKSYFPGALWIEQDSYELYREVEEELIVP